eukprot:6912042-Pyramimonas_sp.AAC.1
MLGPVTLVLDGGPARSEAASLPSAVWKLTPGGRRRHGPASCECTVGHNWAPGSANAPQHQCPVRRQPATRRRAAMMHAACLDASLLQPILPAPSLAARASGGSFGTDVP